ncbi:F4 family fimbrial subunit [Erwinia tasmaniensis]|uniref:K88 fimbrial protein AB n=1 Tax=Erwinia tasmaniensis (strain DSM 17950 / CFBP 7177 / CIP 109463 / NCPPB 4357 / Et1/99) TaxID=465817 RepID=B2VI81_ERWT9|nr:fimbrial protein [Erwinia tasmaniensis]CAO95209.1 K88 fimbrial protein AB precursor [Erwinia tasmaniensis Et1/99]
MKKTLITLALIATAASGSATAGTWTASGAGGLIELSGTLSPVVKITPWEVMTGSGVSDLIGDVQNDQKVTEIEVESAVPILGIRTKDKNLFTGRLGLSPQIDFKDAVNIDKMNDGVGTLTLAVKAMDGSEIGTITAPLTMIGVGYEKSETSGEKSKVLFSASSGQGFFGGLPKKATGLFPREQSVSMAETLIPGVSDNFYASDATIESSGAAEFKLSDVEHSAYYASGITSGSKIQFKLNSLLSETTHWKASLPITVTYI